MSRVIPECDNGEADDLRHEDRMAKQHQHAINAHPDCRDPDHPGCSQCEEGDDFEVEEEECNGCGEPVDDCICDEDDEAYNMLMQEQ